MRDFTTIFSIFIFFIISTACTPPELEYEIISIKFKEDGKGYIQFYTNDVNEIGRHIKCYGQEATMDTVVTKLKKISGYELDYYGIIFCCNNDDTYYRVGITILGHFNIVESVAGVRTELTEWLTDTNSINDGFDHENKIKVHWDATDDIFSLYFNDTLEATFDRNPAISPKGRSGFFVYVGYKEIFPSFPLDVRFKQLQPIAVPD